MPGIDDLDAGFIVFIDYNRSSYRVMTKAIEYMTSKKNGFSSRDSSKN